MDDDIDWKQMVDKAAEDTEEDEEEAPVVRTLLAIQYESISIDPLQFMFAFR